MSKTKRALEKQYEKIKKAQIKGEEKKLKTKDIKYLNQNKRAYNSSLIRDTSQRLCTHFESATQTNNSLYMVPSRISIYDSNYTKNRDKDFIKSLGDRICNNVETFEYEYNENEYKDKIVIYPNQLCINRELIKTYEDLDKILHISVPSLNNSIEYHYYLSKKKYITTPNILHIKNLKDMIDFEEVIFKKDYFYPITIKEFKQENELKIGEISLKTRQLLAYSLAHKYFSRREYRRQILFNLGAGIGKTYLALSIRNLITSTNKRVLIIARNALFDNWKNSIEKMYPGSTVATLSSVSGSKFNKDADFVISTISYLAKPDLCVFTKCKYTEEEMQKMNYDFFSQFSLVIVDEVHENMSSTRTSIFQKISKSFNVFLSATVEETKHIENYTNLLCKKINEQDLVGFAKYSNIDYIKERPNYNIYYERIMWKGPPLYSSKDSSVRKNDEVQYTSILSKISADIFKTIYIARCLAKCALEGRNIILLDNRIEPLYLIHFFYTRLINNKGFLMPYDCKEHFTRLCVSSITDYDDLIDDLVDHRQITELSGLKFKEDSNVLFVNTKNDDLYLEYKKLKENSYYNDPFVCVSGTDKSKIDKTGIILSTYSSMGTGIDIEKLDCLFLTSSKNSYIEQYNGRILRKTTGNDRYIYDFIDTNNNIMERHAINRNDYVKKISDKINNRNVQVDISRPNLYKTNVSKNDCLTLSKKDVGEEICEEDIDTSKTIEYKNKEFYDMPNNYRYVDRNEYLEELKNGNFMSYKLYYRKPKEVKNKDII